MKQENLFSKVASLVQSFQNNEISDTTYQEFQQAIQSFLNIQNNDDSLKRAIIGYSIQLFNNSLKQENLKILLTSVILFDCTNKDISHLNFSNITLSFQEKIRTFWAKLSFDIIIPDTSYSDRQFLNHLKQTINEKDYLNLLSNLEILYNNRTFIKSLNNIGNICCRLVWQTDKALLINFLLENDWSFKIELFLYSLKDYAEEIIPHVMDKRNTYPLFRLLIFLIQKLDENLKDWHNPYDSIPDYTDIITNFVTLHKDIFKDFSHKSRLKNSKSFNYLLGWSTAKNPNLLKEYLSIISEYSQETNEAFCIGYINHANASHICSDSWAILSYWVSNFVKSYNAVNTISGFEYIFINGLAFDYTQKDQYALKLGDFFDNIDQLQYSWEEQNYTSYATIAFYFALANKQKRFHFNDTEIQAHFPILNDKRYQILLGHHTIEIIYQILKEPENTKQILFKKSDGSEILLNFGQT